MFHKLYLMRWAIDTFDGYDTFVYSDENAAINIKSFPKLKTKKGLTGNTDLSDIAKEI